MAGLAPVLLPGSLVLQMQCSSPSRMVCVPSLRHLEGLIQPKIRSRRKSVRGRPNLTIVAGVEEFSSDDFEVQRLISTYGYMNVSSYTGPPSLGIGSGMDNFAAGLDRRDMTQMSGLEMGEGGVQTRIYAGRISSQGERMGTRVLLKAYPGATSRGSEVDMMAMNELVSHAVLQEAAEESPTNLVYLYGGFQTRTGEQWLVFRDSGQLTGADYAKAASEATSKGQAVGQWDFWDRFEPERPILRRRIYITKLLRGAFSGLAFMHSNGRLHQSLGPASVTLNTIEERDVQYLVPQLRDLAFAADVSDEAMLGTSSSNDSWERRGSLSEVRDLPPTAALSAGLWRRAGVAGARTSFERKAFGIADDIYAGGLLLAYMVFVSLCEPGSIDGPSLQRLFESTFRLDVMAAREYCAADERWDEAVKFMDLDDGAGWQLLQAMLNPNYRMRPTAEAVLNHRFMTGAVLE